MSETTKTEQTPVNIAENEIVSNPQAEEITQKATASTEFSPNYNIRNARLTDVNYIKTFAINGKSIAQALAEVVKLAQTPKENSTPLKENEYILTISDELADYATAQEATVEETIDRLLNELKAAQTENAKLRLQTENKKLQAGEVVITFDKKTGENITKVRRLGLLGKNFTWEKNNNTDFLNKLVNYSVNKVLRIDFDNVINPL